MLTRRNLRRSLIVLICLPIVVLGLFIIERKRDFNSTSENSIDQIQRFKRSIDEKVPNVIPIDLYEKPQFRPIIYPVIETKNLERFVHLDLKGAAPKFEFYQKLFPFLKKFGATGLLIEYEDMFPFTGRLAAVRHGLAYSKADVEQLLKLAKLNGLKVMPLLQVYGHMEYVLKLKEFMHLREDHRYPQVITPCLEETYQLIFGKFICRTVKSIFFFSSSKKEMIDQFLTQHPSISYLHLGCDEVYYRLVHPQCLNLNFRDDADLFIK